MVCEASGKIRTDLKRLLKDFHQKGIYSESMTELKFCRMNDDCRKLVLQKLATSNATFGAIIVEKKQVKEALRKNLPILYNWLVVHHIIMAMIPNLENGQKIYITFDKSLPKARITDFNTYVKEKASYLAFERGNHLPKNCLVSNHASSECDPCLQAVDAIAGAYFHKWEKNNSDYVDIINDVTSSIYLWRRK